MTDTLSRLMRSAVDLSEFYRAMAWARLLREAVRVDASAGEWLSPSRVAKVSATAPGRWEAVLLMQSAPTLAKRIVRLLRRLRRRDPRLLMCLDEGEQFIALGKLLDEMPSMHAAGSSITEAVTDALDQIRLGSAGLASVCFHPSLTPSMWASQLEIFRRWWKRLRRQLMPCDIAAELRRPLKSMHAKEFPSREGERLVATILNKLWGAALAKRSTGQFLALQSRWQPPLALIREADTLAELGAALILLPDEELAYVGALIHADLCRA